MIALTSDAHHNEYSSKKFPITHGIPASISSEIGILYTVYLTIYCFIDKLPPLAERSLNSVFPAICIMCIKYYRYLSKVY